MRAWTPAWEHWYRRALPAYWLFLFLSTHLPQLTLPGAGSDKITHVVGFGLLALLFWKFCESFGRPLPDWFVLAAAIVLAAYAALDEWTQQFVGRGTDWQDWLADTVGIGLALGALEWRRRAAGAAARSSRSDAGGTL